MDLFRDDEPGLNSGWGRGVNSKLEHYFTARLDRSLCGSASKNNVMHHGYEPDAPKQGGCPKCLRLTKEKR